MSGVARGDLQLYSVEPLVGEDMQSYPACLRLVTFADIEVSEPVSWYTPSTYKKLEQPDTNREQHNRPIVYFIKVPQ